MTDPKPLVDVCETCGTDSCVPWEIHEKVLHAYEDLCKEITRMENQPVALELRIADAMLKKERRRVQYLTWALGIVSGFATPFVLWVVLQ